MEKTAGRGRREAVAHRRDYAKSMTKQELYVSVENPGTLRRSVLEASKQLIGMLRTYERLRVIRAEKKETLSKLKSALADMGTAVSEIRHALPEIKTSELPRIQQPKAKPAPKPMQAERKPEQKEQKPKPAVHRRTEVEKLEEELGRIEERLRGL